MPMFLRFEMSFVQVASKHLMIPMAYYLLPPFLLPPHQSNCFHFFFPAENGRQDENPSLLELPSANSEAEPQPLVSCSSHVSHTGALACKAKLQRVLAGQNHNHKSKLCEKLFPVEFGDAPSQLQKYQSGFQLQLQAP